MNTTDALRQLQAWIEHWQADVAAGLKPTPESLEAARKLVTQAMAGGEA